MRFILLSFLFACSTTAPKNQSWDHFWGSVNMVGTGKTRLEVGKQSWVASFDSNFSDNSWQMSIAIPTQGEELFQFPALNLVKPDITPNQNDFRWRIIQALREASHQRKLNYPQLGQDFINKTHYIMRWINAKNLNLDSTCQSVSLNIWECRWDGVKSQWNWNESKGELVGVLSLRKKYYLRVYFRNLTESVFKRVTFEVSQNESQRQDVELRQDIFFVD